jgi:hypothetical protein
MSTIRRIRGKKITRRAKRHTVYEALEKEEEEIAPRANPEERI